MAPFIITIVICLIAAIIFGVIFKDKPKIDKGPNLFYYSLSYRRKMIRNAMVFPVIVVWFLALFLLVDLSPLVLLSLSAIVLISFVGQFVYNYFMWKKKER